MTHALPRAHFLRRILEPLEVKAAVEHLSATTSYVQCVVEPYFETQFELRLKQLVVQYGDAMKQAKVRGGEGRLRAVQTCAGCFES